jgi:homoserine kinase
VQGYDEVVQAARSAGAFGATLSGSGSTICGLTPRYAVHDVAAAMVKAWRRLDVQAEAIVCEAPAGGYSATVGEEYENDLNAGAGGAARNNFERQRRT